MKITGKDLVKVNKSLLINITGKLIKNPIIKRMFRIAIVCGTGQIAKSPVAIMAKEANKT